MSGNLSRESSFDELETPDKTRLETVVDVHFGVVDAEPFGKQRKRSAVIRNDTCLDVSAVKVNVVSAVVSDEIGHVPKVHFDYPSGL